MSDESSPISESESYVSSTSISSVESQLPYKKDKALTQVLEIDKNTKDSHVARDPRLLRLTGSHPFNSEPPLTLLYNQGFITPSNLHFVRNHGPVPEVEDDTLLDWTFSIEGMVEKPFTISIRDMITEFPQYTNPITLCCAGNRRKEQNLVKKGKGFNWGAAGVSTSLWTGCMLQDLIERASPYKKARYLWMEGGDSPAKGAYGTCVPLHMAKDPERAIMVAYKQNGEYLSPDHGRPLRCVIPGVIGGRSVKWLKRIVIADLPSDNWYHYYDNKVLPTSVTSEIATAEDHWWKDERYAIYDLNLQTITVFPEMNEKMVVDDSTEDELYEIKGFAYNGGGKRVGRVEISLDRGKTWTLCEIDYPEDRFREAGYIDMFGATVNVCERFSSLCWCFWSLNVRKKDLKGSKEILVRGMDTSMTVQPRNMYWNLTSMLNNWWYRVAIQPGSTENEIVFEHPCFANSPGGWMERVKANGGDILDNTWGENDEETSVSVKREVIDEDLLLILNPEKKDVIITKAELEQHANAQDPWFLVKGHVFEGTPFLEEHPGGVQSITMVAGEDATEDFLAIHSENSKKMMQKFHIGKLEVSGDSTTSPTPISFAPQELSPTLLNPKIWKKIKLIKKDVISHDSRIFHFALEHPEQTTGLPVGKHFFIRSKNSKDKFVMRAYTPKSNHRVKGILEILVKVYFPKGDAPGGEMTMILENLSIGSDIEIKGPIGEFEYLGRGDYLFNEKPGRANSFLMIAGGSGITPCYQIIAEISSDKEDKTKVTMFYGNRFEEDILCRDDLDAFKQSCHDLSVDHCLSGTKWSGFIGRFNREHWDRYIAEHSAHGDFLIMVCGPPGMVDTVKALAKEDGVDSSKIVYF